MMKVVLVLASLLVAAFSYASDGELANSTAADQEANAGQVLFEKHCLACHQPKGAGGKHGAGAGAEQGHSKRLAPPMEMVKKHYLETYPERDAFVGKVSAWVAAPDSDTALLGHALERFGLMPPLVVDAASRKLIAEYIFDTVPVGQCNKGGGGKHGQHAGEQDKEGQTQGGQQGHGKQGHGKQGQGKQGDGGCQR